MDMRDAIFDTLYDIAKKDKDVVLITADADAFGIRKFKKDFPNRFFNIGVAEQNMINVASGLALSGKKVFVCAIAPFATFRCFEQIKANMCGMNLPVFIIGLGIGLSFGYDGPTHHAVCDIGVMRNLPELSIYNPSDSISAEYCVRDTYYRMRPSYIRVDKGEFHPLYDDGSDLADGFSIIKDGEKDTIISTGICTQYAMSFNHNAKVIDLFRLKPCDKKMLLEAIKTADRVITYEEHVANSGIGNIVADILAEAGMGIPLKKMALSEEQCFEYGDREWLHSKCGIDKDSIDKEINGLGNI